MRNIIVHLFLQNVKQNVIFLVILLNKAYRSVYNFVALYKFKGQLIIINKFSIEIECGF